MKCIARHLIALLLLTIFALSLNSSDSSAATNYTTYKVKSGDSLWSIAIKKKSTIAKIKKINKLKKDTLFIGTILKIPKNKKTTTTTIKKEEQALNKPVSTTTSTAISNYTKSEKKKIEKAIAIIESKLGTPYVWGGTTASGFDCSGLIYYAFNKAGVSMPRLTTKGFHSLGTGRANPTRGDIVYFKDTAYSGQGISHMGVYLGNYQFIHAGVSQGVSFGNLTHTYWKNYFAGYQTLHTF